MLKSALRAFENLAATDDRLGQAAIQAVAPARMGPIVGLIQPASMASLIVEDVLGGAVSPQHHGGRRDSRTPLRTRDVG
jgi:hypothetical protein